jgi:6-phosphofructokinase
MKPSEMLNQIKNVLGIELSAEVEAQAEVKVELAQMTLENGTVIEAEEFAPEFEVFIVTEEERIALPVGEYLLEEGRILVVEEEGIIKEIKSEESEGDEAEVEVEAAEEVKEEEMGYVKKEEFAAAIDEIKAMIDEVKAGMKEKEEMAQVLKEELSATPAAAPLKHNPEAEAKKQMFNYSSKRAASTKDNVLSKIAKINK